MKSQRRIILGTAMTPSRISRRPSQSSFTGRCFPRSFLISPYPDAVYPRADENTVPHVGQADAPIQSDFLDGNVNASAQKNIEVPSDRLESPQKVSGSSEPPQRRLALAVWPAFD